MIVQVLLYRNDTLVLEKTASVGDYAMASIYVRTLHSKDAAVDTFLKSRAVMEAWLYNGKLQPIGIETPLTLDQSRSIARVYPNGDVIDRLDGKTLYSITGPVEPTGFMKAIGEIT